MDAKMFCKACGKQFSSRSNLLRHLRESCPYRNDEPPPKKLKIDQPQTDKFKNSASMSNPNAEIISSNTSLIECPVCGESVPTHSFVGHMRRNSHKTIKKTLEEGVEQLNNSLKFRIASFRFSSKLRHINHSQFFAEIQEKVFQVLLKHLREWGGLKVNFELFSMYVIPNKDMFDLKSFNTENQIITFSTDLLKIYNDLTKVIIAKASDMQERDSGWSLQQIMFLEVNINRYNPLNGGLYMD